MRDHTLKSRYIFEFRTHDLKNLQFEFIMIQRGSFLDHLQIQYPTKIIKKLNNFPTSLSKLTTSNGYLNNKKNQNESKTKN